MQGELFEAAAEYGNSLLGSSLNYARVVGQYGLVRKVPEEWGIFPNSRFAFRAYGGWSWPGSASLFRLGGGQRLRALDLTWQEGSSVWLMTAEWRFPDLARHEHRRARSHPFVPPPLRRLPSTTSASPFSRTAGARSSTARASASAGTCSSSPSLSAPPFDATSPSPSACAAARCSGSGSTRCSDFVASSIKKKTGAHSHSLMQDRQNPDNRNTRCQRYGLRRLGSLFPSGAQHSPEYEPGG